LWNAEKATEPAPSAEMVTQRRTLRSDGIFGGSVFGVRKHAS
jgi:hypothetical protein